MLRYLSLLLLFYPLFECIGKEISYRGIAFECGSTCVNRHMWDIQLTLKNTFENIFEGVSPVDITFETKASFRPWITTDKRYEFKVYDWAATQNIYTKDHPSEYYSCETYTQFLELTAALRRDLYFYRVEVRRVELNLYKSMLSWLKDEYKRDPHRAARWNYPEKMRFIPYRPEFDPSYHWLWDMIRDLERYLIPDLEEKLAGSFLKIYENKKTTLEKALLKIDALYQEVFLECLTNHQPEGIVFRNALENFLTGNFEQGIEQIRELIEIVEENNLQEDLLPKLYLLKGQFESEFGQYADAVVDFTTAIQKNPAEKEAYFDRAVAYFELGEFDKSLEDYIASGVRPPPLNSTQLGLGIGAGIIEGASVSLKEFVPSMLTTARGLGNGLWALAQNPVGTSQELVNGAIRCIEYLRSHTPKELIQDMVPELKELIKNYDNLGDFQKGQLIGKIIGRYGVDILLAKYTVAGVKAYRELKKANQLMTLETLTSLPGQRKILEESSKRWAERQKFLKQGNLKIQMDKQGKHIEGHRNYNELKVRGENPSILMHPDPERLIQEYAGTGIKDGLDVAQGMPGYKEIVNFEEVIGYAVNKDTGEKIATTWGKIHYAKDGVHIVPFQPGRQ